MAYSSQPRRTYHVFLSFRGPDGRDNIVSHLYNALIQAGIYTYIDSEELKKGERISDALPKAIEDSRIALIVFSEQYATSSWCLKEVAKIMEGKETNGLFVLPVYFKVDPREVRGGRKSYKEAFDAYENKCKDGKAVGFDSEDVEKWKKALKDAGELSGWVYDNRVIKELKNGTLIQSGSSEFKSEGELVKFIVKEISILQTRIPCHVAKYPVGMVSRVNDLISILRMRSRDEVLTIGLWAMGGMGKTTLAIALYNSIFENFDGSVFLDGISSDSKNLESLQEKLLFALTKQKIRVTSWHQGINLISDRLCRKRVLLILDGVDDIRQIEALAGEHNWFGDGSRIIVTTRHKNVLSEIKAIIHEVKTLEVPEARELFKKYASGNGNIGITGCLVDEALRYTQRLPLALKELGSTFFVKDKSAWKSELYQFAGSSHPTIHNVLKESLRGLDGTTKDIFLDIACFFDGWNRKYVEGLLGSCYFDGCSDDSCYDQAAHVVNDLIQRSLMKDENGTLRVHRLIKLMGQTIADADGGHHHQNLRKRRRLWRREEVFKVLSGDKGQYDVEAIVLAPTKPEEIKKIGSNPFAKLTKLRFLIMINVEASFPGPIDLPDQLRWFEWPECPASSLKFSCTPLNPALLAVRKSLLVKNRGEP